MLQRIVTEKRIPIHEIAEAAKLLRIQYQLEKNTCKENTEQREFAQVEQEEDWGEYIYMQSLKC